MLTIFPRFNFSQSALRQLRDLVKATRLQELHIHSSRILQVLPQHKNTVSPLPPPILVADLKSILGIASELHVPAAEFSKMVSQLLKSRSSQFQFEVEDSYKIKEGRMEFRLAKQKELENIPYIDLSNKNALCQPVKVTAQSLTAIRGLRNSSKLPADIFIRGWRASTIGIFDQDTNVYDAEVSIDEDRQIEAGQADVIFRATYFAPAWFKGDVEMEVLCLPKEGHHYWLKTKIPLDGINGYILEPVEKITEKMRQRDEREISSQLSALASHLALGG